MAAEVAVRACAEAQDLDVIFCCFDERSAELHQAAIARRAG
jgi:hypothetical protein